MRQSTYELSVYRKTTKQPTTVESFLTRAALLHVVLALCLILSNRAFAQAPFIFPSSASVGGAPSTMAVAVKIQSPGLLANVQVLGQGSANVDFSASSPTTCVAGPYAQGQICSVSVNFAPKYPGLRLGAVLLVANDGHIMADQNISGVGTGSLSVMAPGEINTLAGDGCLNDGSCPTSGANPATSSALNLPLGEATDGL